MGHPTLLKDEDIHSFGNAVLDDKTARALEVESLGEKVRQYCITHTGDVFIREHIFNPSTDGEEVRLKQDALRELRSNDKLRQRATDFLERVKYREGTDENGKPVKVDKEAEVIGFFNKHTGFRTLSATRNLLANLPDWANEMPEAESSYLRALQEDIQSLNGSRARELSQRPVYRQLGRGVVAKSELKWHLPAVRYRPYLHTTAAALTGGGLLGFGAYKLISLGGDAGEMEILFPAIFGVIGATGAGGIASEIIMGKFVRPLKKYFREASEVNRALTAIGSLDELVAQDEFGRSLGEFSSLPEILDGRQHELYAEGLVNPLQYLKNSDGYVPNDIHWGGGKQLVFFTGPNSGGKTSASTAAQHAQILFQTGGYVPARSARMTIADRIYNQVVEPNGITDDEGGLGSQLRRSKEILFGCSPHSFVVIDDLNEATTFEEKMEITGDILYGFLHKGPTAVYVSHLYQLAQQFQDKGLGDYLQVEFNGTKPTHRVVPGISTRSHADLVARRIGIDDSSISNHLREQGYISGNGDFREVDRFREAYK